MPRYDYLCEHCGIIQDVYARISEEVVECPRCGMKAQRKFSPPESKPIIDIEPYWDENISDKPIYIQSRKHKAMVLKEHGLKMKRGISDYR
jgi:putative FmdB family regulatory protein